MRSVLVAEYVSAISLLIIIIYSRDASFVPNLKNNLFRYSTYAVFASIVITIFSTRSAENYRTVPLPLNVFLCTLYFLVISVMPLLFNFYTNAYLLEDSPKLKNIFLGLSVPYILASILYLTNPFTKLIFYFDESGYHRGDLNITTLILVILYSISIFTTLVALRKRTPKATMLIFGSIPLLVLSIFALQILFPRYVLTGSICTIATLILYLYLQNKRITIDVLTGFQNKTAFLSTLDMYLHKNEKISILLISLDDFKAVNDKFDEKTGDEFLVSISSFLKSILPSKILFRYSGDEFAIIIDDDMPIDSKGLVDILLRRFSHIWSNGRCSYKLTVSISVVETPAHANNVDDAVILLEYLIDRCKANGKAQALFCTKGTIDNLKRKNHITEILKEKIQNKEYTVLYQPIYSVEEKMFTSAESLLRVSDKDLGMIFPDEFIPIAEETGLIVDIGFIVLDKVCKFIKHLEEQKIKVDGISVNYSALQMIHENIVEETLRIIESNGIEPSKIRIEITESTFIENFDEVLQVMNRLQNKGVLFYLDDFGTGYSNLSYVTDLPFDFIKLDKSLVYHCETNEKSYNLMDALCNAFRISKMNIIAEGVETLCQCDLVFKLGGNYIQGYYYARPVPEEKAIEYFCLEKAAV